MTLDEMVLLLVGGLNRVADALEKIQVAPSWKYLKRKN
jgi:hypothetical protein